MDIHAFILTAREELMPPNITIPMNIRLLVVMAKMECNEPFSVRFNQVILDTIPFHRKIRESIEGKDRASTIALLESELHQMERAHSPENFLSKPLADAPERIYQILVTRELIRRCQEALETPLP